VGEAEVTVIAWDGKTLAGDRLASYGGTKVRTRKVFRVTDRNGKEWLIGAAGDKPLLEAWRAWFCGKTEERPAIAGSDEFTVLMIDRSHRVWQMQYTLTPWRIPAKFAAVGSARGEALGAMVMGADARRAVLVAQKIDATCGLGVDCVSFE
jgi:hypothetical protein